MITVNMLKAKTNLSKLVEAVESGAEKEIIIARNGRPVARLVPIEAPRTSKRKLGLLEGQFPSMSMEEFNAPDKDIERWFLGEDDDGSEASGSLGRPKSSAKE